MKLELTIREKVWLIGLITYELDNASEEVKNNSNRYLVFKGILDKLYKIEQEKEQGKKVIINGDDNEIKYKILALAIIIVSDELGEEEDANKGLSLFECLNTLSIIQDKYKLNKEV